MLSGDDMYTKTIQQLQITPPAWHKERNLRKISLGGLLLLILFRIINVNISKMFNTHVHAATIAIVCNLSPSIVDMEPIVAQKLVS